MNDYRYLTEIYHHGILNQKWGVRNGPPYPLSGGQYSKSEKQAVYKERKKKNSIYNKKHFDKVISTDDKVSTLSYNKDRSKGADYIYATYKNRDKQQYKAMFNYVIPNDGGGDARRAKDIQNQRNKFFKALEAEGYGALLDTNDAIYGSFKAEAPVIIFNMKNLVVEDAKRVSTADKAYSSLVTAGRKALNM